MGYSNYDQIERAIEDHRVFEGNSASAERDVWGQYIVYSYATRILSISLLGKVTYFDNRYYSRTTSRLQGIIRRAIPALHDCAERRVYRFDVKED